MSLHLGVYILHSNEISREEKREGLASLKCGGKTQKVFKMPQNSLEKYYNINEAVHKGPRSRTS